MGNRSPNTNRIRVLMRECGAAFLLTMSVLTAYPDPTAEPPPAIVRMARQSHGDFDNREWIGAATVLTVPLASMDQSQLSVAYGEPVRDRLN